MSAPGSALSAACADTSLRGALWTRSSKPRERARNLTGDTCGSADERHEGLENQLTQKPTGGWQGARIWTQTGRAPPSTKVATLSTEFNETRSLVAWNSYIQDQPRTARHTKDQENPQLTRESTISWRRCQDDKVLELIKTQSHYYKAYSKE